jgi:integrating conjugative element protein (TIGR03765 family)
MKPDVSHPAPRILPAILFAALTAFSAHAQTRAPLIVVEEHGGKSALPYHQALPPRPPEKRAASPARTPKRGEAAMLPVRSLKLSPGRGTARQVPGWGCPVFLVGDDEISRRWLKANGARLEALGASGLVVQVEMAEALARLRALAPGLLLSPVCGDALAERFGLRHYPVLISATGIEP